MTPRQRVAPFALLFLLLLPAAALAQGQFFFIHVPPTSPTGPGIDQITDGLKEIGEALEDNWETANPGKTPKVCWVGYAGPWEAGGANHHNNAGEAANRIGNESATDNQEGFSMPIDYCAVSEILEELLAKCDIVIAMGEGLGDSFDLEEHGDPTTPPDPDCADHKPDTPVCSGEGCSGTDWDERITCGDEWQGCYVPTFSEWIVCQYEGNHAGDPPGSYIPVKPGSGAGSFLCGWACCGGHKLGF
jgi:hypothetical protein